MPNLAASQVSPFVGTRDFAVSRDFYVALGWQLLWDRGDLAQLELAGQRIAGGAFGAARVTPPKREPHGALVTYIWDPAGVLLHMAQPLKG